MRVEELKEIEARATPRPWKWWTSCSWRRMYGDVNDRPVMVPTNHPIDKHPDIAVATWDMNKIEAACNHFAALLAVAEAADKMCNGEIGNPAIVAFGQLGDALRDLEAVK